MGIGDKLLASGISKGAWANRGKRIAFGDGSRIIWDQNSAPIFRNNPNVAKPGEEHKPWIEWVKFYKGYRIYNSQDMQKNCWVWNYDFKAQPGEIYLDHDELSWAGNYGKRFVIIEPNIETWKGCAPNKQWPFERYQEIATKLHKSGYPVVQLIYNRSCLKLNDVTEVFSPTFRHAMAIMSKARLYIGAEGGLHHAAAAVHRPAVVLFGGFVPPEVTGYDSHINLTGGAKACGSLFPCDHCKEAMLAISVDEVMSSALEYLWYD